MTTKTNYKYYLANGACIEYALSPDCSLIDVIERLVGDYYVCSQYRYYNDHLYVRPEITSALNRELIGRQHLLGNIPHPTGMELLKLQTMAGPITIEIKLNMEFPIFMGSEQELKDNSFNALMKDILS